MINSTIHKDHTNLKRTSTRYSLGAHYSGLCIQKHMVESFIQNNIQTAPTKSIFLLKTVGYEWYRINEKEAWDLQYQDYLGLNLRHIDSVFQYHCWYHSMES